MPEHDSWDEGRLPRSGTFVCLVISAQKQLKSASVGRKPRNSVDWDCQVFATNYVACIGCHQHNKV